MKYLFPPPYKYKRRKYRWAKARRRAPPPAAQVQPMQPEVEPPEPTDPAIVDAVDVLVALGEKRRHATTYVQQAADKGAKGVQALIRKALDIRAEYLKR